MDLRASQELVATTRSARTGQTIPLLPHEEKDRLLHQYHPDYRAEAYRSVRVGPNAGEATVNELADLLEATSPIPPTLDLRQPDQTVDVLVIGGGGAGCVAALTAKAEGASILIATKLRLGDSNTVMAEGGMQVSVAGDDSPIRHFLDTMKGGYMKNDPVLLRTLVEEGPFAAKWLMDLGVLFDGDEAGELHLKTGGGASRPRLLTCKDYTGLEIMRVLKDCVINEPLATLEFAPVVELLSGEDGRCTGAVAKHLDTDRYVVISAKAVIMTTGGIGRLHIQGFPTSNHFGATGDGLVLAYRLGAGLCLHDTFQYHPTGAIHPEPMVGLLVTEATRSAGAQLVNGQGKRFIHEMDLRDVVAAAVLRECADGRGVETPTGHAGVWLDIPLVDALHGTGTIEQRFPNMIKQFSRFDIDIRKDPVLVYPTLHYQNGGIKMAVNGESTVPGLFVAGEASGGVHGRNRLMGNSLLDLIVFGRRAGRAAAAYARSAPPGALTLRHLERFGEDLARAGIVSNRTSPLLFPDYVRR